MVTQWSRFRAAEDGSVCAEVEAPLPHPHYSTTYSLLFPPYPGFTLAQAGPVGVLLPLGFGGACLMLGALDLF